MPEFLALDVETANADYSSICQIGIVHFLNGKIQSEWSTLVNPNTYFDPYNVGIHGIDASLVENAPTFASIYPELRRRMTGQIILHHGHFDRTAFYRVYEESELEEIDARWLNNQRVVRRVWNEFSQSGYGLANLATYFGLPLDHHNAVSDAKVAGQIFLTAQAKTGTSSEDWLTNINARISPITASANIAVNANGPFFGDKIVFTGELAEPRKKLQEIAASLGFEPVNSVSKKVTTLCVGSPPMSAIEPGEKTSKHKKAEDLASQGHSITILSERDFWKLVELEGAL